MRMQQRGRQTNGQKLPLKILKYIFGKGKRHKLWKHLEQRHKRRRVKSGRHVYKEKPHSRIPHAVSIDMRLKRANTRSQIGHFETDLMEGTRSQKTALSVAVERKSRHTSLGTVENTIKRIRRYIPKGSSIKKLTNIQILWVENRINNRPMKCLHYQTPNEVMEKEANSYKFRRFTSSKETSVALQLRM